MSEYQVGGSLKVNAATYVTRKADDILYRELCRGEFCYVFNCRQMGKSSLRVQTKNSLEQQGYACVSLDMTNIGSQTISSAQWYKSIASEIQRGLNILGRVSLKKWWQEHSDLSPLQHLNLFISDVVLNNVTAEKIFIFVDEIDSVLSLDFTTDDFFALIRYFYNARAENPQFNRLCFALFGVATPSQLISDRSRTPFNIGKAIELTGFELVEAEPLIGGLSQSFSHSRVILAEILYWTGGQPFLTQKLCQLAVANSHNMADCSSPEQLADWIAKLTREKIIDNWESQDEPEHLKTIRDRLLKNEGTVSRLLGLTEQILRHGSIAADESWEQRQLLLSNLVVKHRERLSIRNPIYREIFNLAWVESQSDKLCPYSRELRLWLVSEGQDSSRLLRGIALEDARAWANNHSIGQEEYKFLNASQEQEQAAIRQKLELKRLKEVETRLFQEQKLAKIQGFFLGTVGAGLAIASILGVTAYRNYQNAKINAMRAEKNQLVANTTSAESLFNSERVFASLIEALKATKNISSLSEIDESLKSDAEQALQQAVYNIAEKNTFSWHRDVVNSVSYSKNGRLIASASSDNTIAIWRGDGKLLETLEGHQDGVISVAFSPRQDILVSGSEDNKVKLWTIDGRLIDTFSSHRGSVNQVTFNPQGDLIASASEDKTIGLWNLEGELVNVLIGHDSEVMTVAFSPDGKTIATGDRSGTLKLWNLRGREIISFPAHSLPIRDIDFSPDGRQIVTGGDDNLAMIWQRDGNLVRILDGYDAPVTGVRFSPDGNLIGTSSWDKSIKLWHRDGTLSANLLGHQARVWQLAWSPDGQTIATAGWDTTVKLWQVRDPLVKTFYGHEASVLSVAYQPQGQLIVSTSEDRTVKLWQPDGTIQTNFTDHSAEIYEAAFSPDGSLVASTSLDRMIKVWRTDGDLLHTFIGHEAPTADIYFLPDGKGLVSAGNDQTIRFWQLNNSKNQEIEADLRKTIFAHQAAITDIDLSADGKLLASVSHDRYLKLWNQQGKLLHDVLADSTGLRTVYISPDSQIIATGGKDHNIKLWDKNGEPIRRLEGHRAIILDVEFSPDGSKIASASADNTIKIWNTSGELLTTLRGHRGRVWNVAFSPDGKQLASASEDTSVRLWEIERILQIDHVEYGCSWVANYLKTNLEFVQEGDRQICS